MFPANGFSCSPCVTGLVQADVHRVRCQFTQIRRSAGELNIWIPLTLQMHTDDGVFRQPRQL